MACFIAGPSILTTTLLIVFFVHPASNASFYDTEVACPAPRLLNGRVRLRQNGVIAKFQCRPGSILWGPKYATCIHGEWDDKPPVCVQPGCRPLQTMKNGKIMVRFQGSVATLICDKGYYIMMISLSYPRQTYYDKSIPVANIYCDGRRWNTTGYQCVALPTTAGPITTPLQTTTTEGIEFTNTFQEITIGPNLVTTGPDLDSTTGVSENGGVTVLPTIGHTGMEVITNTSSAPPILPASPTPLPSSSASPTAATTASPVPTTAAPPSPATPKPSTPSPTPTPTQSTTVKVTPASSSTTTPKTIPPSLIPILPGASSTSPPQNNTSSKNESLTWCDFDVTRIGWQRLSQNGRLSRTNIKSPNDQTWCGWEQRSEASNISWYLNSGDSYSDAPSYPSIRKPQGGSLKSGYMAGPTSETFKRATLVSPEYQMSSFNASKSRPCFIFWYKTFKGILQVNIESNNISSPVWMENTTRNDWKLASIPLAPKSGSFRISLVADFNFFAPGLVSLDNLWLTNNTACSLASRKYYTGGVILPTSVVTKKPVFTSPAKSPSTRAPYKVTTRTYRNVTGHVTLPRSTMKTLPPAVYTSSAIPVKSTPITKKLVTTKSVSSTTSEGGVSPILIDEKSDSKSSEEETSLGVPLPVIWAIAAISVVALIVFMGVCIRRYTNRRQRRLREGGDGDSEIRYLTSDQEHLDFNLHKDL